MIDQNEILTKLPFVGMKKISNKRAYIRTILITLIGGLVVTFQCEKKD